MRFILGRSGTGKSTKVLDEIKNCIESGFDKPIIYIVPEQFSFEAEKRLINVIGKNGVIGTQVLSFKRLCYKIFNENNINVNPLKGPGESMLIYFIMLKLEKDLLVLNGVSNNVGLVQTVVDEISEFKRYNIMPETIKDIDFKNEYLNRKMHDLSLIYEEYQKRISDIYVDSNDDLTILAEVINNRDYYLDGAKVWIDEFDGFIPQELEIIKALDKKCDVTISMISDKDEIFELNNINVDKLRKLSNKQDEDIVFGKVLRFNNEELRYLEANIFKVPYEKYDKDTNNIFVSSYNNLHEEIESIAKEIIRLLRSNENIRFSNIAVLTRDIDVYKNIFKLIFPTYGIPYFLDNKKSLAQEPLMTLILSFFDIISNNYQYEAMFTYLKTGLTNIEDENDIDLIENYVLKWGIKGKKWEEDFIIEDVNLEKINSIREQIVIPIIAFKNNFDGRKTVKEIATSLYEFLSSINVFDNLEAKISKLIEKQNSEDYRFATEYSQVCDIFINILDEMVATIGDEQVSFDKFKSVFKIGISNQEISVIPTTKDEVIIGDAERTRNADIEYLFIVGVNDGSFPKTFSSEGFLNDKERELLLENGVEIAKDTKKLLKQEYFNMYKALSTAKDKLYISYPTSDLEGKTRRQAFIINQIKSLFPNIKELAIDDMILNKKASFLKLLTKLRDEKDGYPIDDEWKYVDSWYRVNDQDRYNSITSGLDYKNTIESQDKSVSRLLYGKNMNTSVSRLENYELCPFSFYLRYGLKLREREVYKLETPDIGSFLHEIIEKFSKKVLEEDIDLRSITREQSDEIVSNISDEVLINFRHNLFSSTGKLRNLSVKLKEQVKKTIWLIIIHIKSGEFNLMGSEVEFGKGKEYPEIIIELSEDNKLILSGKVDRVDVADLGDEKYIRIIDYKSSNKSIKLSNVYYGVQLQLLAYSDAISTDAFKPGGVFYLKLDDPIARVDKKISKEEIEDSIIKTLRMNGLIISNVKLIEAMDSEFNESKDGVSYESEILNLKKSKEGKFSKMPIVSEKDFEKLRIHMRKTLKDIGDEIMSGNVKNEPLERKGVISPCDYCSFKKACMFDRSLGNRVRRLNELKDEEVLEKL